jgi:hypothetical protein
VVLSLGSFFELTAFAARITDSVYSIRLLIIPLDYCKEVYIVQARPYHPNRTKITIGDVGRPALPSVAVFV